MCALQYMSNVIHYWLRIMSLVYWSSYLLCPFPITTQPELTLPVCSLHSQHSLSTPKLPHTHFIIPTNRCNQQRPHLYMPYSNKHNPILSSAHYNMTHPQYYQPVPLESPSLLSKPSHSHSLGGGNKQVYECNFNQPNLGRLQNRQAYQDARMAWLCGNYKFQEGTYKEMKHSATGYGWIPD